MTLSEETTFDSNLAASFTLTDKAETLEIHSGHIEFVNLELKSYGFTCTIHFTDFDDDKVDKVFSSEKVLHAEFAVKSPDEKKHADKPLFEVKGLVTNRSFKRIKQKDDDVRWYELTFCDAARACWSEHFPVNVYVDTTMKDVLTKHKSPLIDLKLDWDVLDATHPVIAFNLEDNTFYSFLHWYLHTYNGLLLYDYKKNTYSITGKKPPKEGKDFEVNEWWATPPVCELPPVLRQNHYALNHSTDKLDPKETKHDNAFPNMRRDQFVHTNNRTFPEQAHLEIKSDALRKHHLVHFFIDAPDPELNVSDPGPNISNLFPGSFISFHGNRKKKGTWSEDPAFKKQVFRTVGVVFEASKMSDSTQVKHYVENFLQRIRVEIEPEKEVYVDRFNFTPPTFPFQIQGKVHSQVGDKEQTTFNIKEDDNAPKGQYLVDVPLAGKDKRVVVPFTPGFMTGQHYFPLCKDERVLLDLYFHTALILRTLDWQPLTRLPSDTQACQIVFASNTKDKFTTIKQEYENGKEGVLTITHSTSDEQKQTIVLKDKSTKISVEEKDKIALSLEMDNKSGITLKREDKDASITHTTQFNKKTMTHTCKGDDGTSVITQAPDTVSVKCKKFIVDAEDTVSLKAKTIEQAGKTKINLEAKVTNVKSPTVKLG